MHWITIFATAVVIGQGTEILVWLVQAHFWRDFKLHAYVCDITHTDYQPLELIVSILASNTKFWNQARSGQIEQKPMKSLKTNRSGDLHRVSVLAWVKPSVCFWVDIWQHCFFHWCPYSTVVFIFISLYQLSRTRQLVSKFNSFGGSFLVTESPCYIAGCENREQLQASDIFRETPG